tara:strand:- start:32 stop:544 length:513 start_codon:yes stop_codon:yes gene_type:complete
MDKREFLPLMNYLYTAYRETTNKQELKVYYNSLGIFHPETVMEAIKGWVDKSSFFPRVADLLKLIHNKEISFDDVMKDLHRIISGGSFNRSQLHPVSYQILNELGGKMSVSQLSEIELRKQVAMKFKYVVNEHILEIGYGEKPEIGNRGGESSLKQLMTTKLLEEEKNVS